MGGEVYGTPKASSSSAFDDGLGGQRVETLEEPWKAWTAGFPGATQETGER